jgi:hypothetical protein
MDAGASFAPAQINQMTTGHPMVARQIIQPVATVSARRSTDSMLRDRAP